MDVDNGLFIKLRIILEGDALHRHSCSVRVKTTDTIEELKDAIKEKMHPAFANVNVVKIQIFKVTIPIEDSLANLSGDELRPADVVLKYWPSQPPLQDNSAQYIHVIIKCPTIDYHPLKRPRLDDDDNHEMDQSSQIADSSSTGSLVNYPPLQIEMYTPRLETVHGIYKKLQASKYIQIRGTPASGKTALAKLLHHHILQMEPEARVTRVTSWRTSETMPKNGYREWLKSKCNFLDGSVLVVDEAQSSYWDTDFWLELKGITPESRFRVLTFATHGSAGRNITDALTPFRISPVQSVSLAAVNHGDDIAVGLLLTKTEFNALVDKVFDGHYFDASFLSGVFDATDGHVGACEDLLRVVCAHGSYRSKKTVHRNYTHEDFITGITMVELLKQLSIGSKFCRGLPTTAHLQDTSLSEVLRKVLCEGSIAVPVSLDEPHNAVEKSPIRRCFEAGWLHNEAVEDGKYIAYTFASPLHKRYVQWMLLGKLEEGVIHENYPLEFAVSVIHKFNPLNLTAKRTLGTTVQSTPEAQFQDEFYRACISHTSGCVVSFPEFGNQHGRVDFFIPSKKWGIELLRNGDRLNAHSKRFTMGEYGRWISNQKMDDYAIIDFRTKPPHKCQDIANLYYAVSTDNWHTIEVLDNKLGMVEKFTLLFQ